MNTQSTTPASRFPTKHTSLTHKISIDVILKHVELNIQFTILCEHYTEANELIWTTEGWRAIPPRPLLPSKVKLAIACRGCVCRYNGLTSTPKARRQAETLQRIVRDSYSKWK